LTAELNKLPSNKWQPAIPAELEDYYYRARLVTCDTKDSSGMLIHLRVPLNIKQQKYEAHQLTPKPVAWNNSVCELELEAELAVKVGEHVLLYSHREKKRMCDSTVSHLCRRDTAAEARDDETCITAIRRKSTIGKLQSVCTFKCTEKTLAVRSLSRFEYV